MGVTQAQMDGGTRVGTGVTNGPRTNGSDARRHAKRERDVVCVYATEARSVCGGREEETYP